MKSGPRRGDEEANRKKTSRHELKIVHDSGTNERPHVFVPAVARAWSNAYGISPLRYLLVVGLSAMNQWLRCRLSKRFDKMRSLEELGHGPAKINEIDRFCDVVAEPCHNTLVLYV